MNIEGTKNKLIHFAVSVLLGVIGGVFLIFTLYKGVPLINNNEYRTFLERAENAATTGVAQEEISGAVAWLEDNRAINSFDYRNLQGISDYLQEQPKQSIVPTEIKSSIDQSIHAIESKENIGVLFIILGLSLSLVFFKTAWDVFISYDYSQEIDTD